MQGKNATEKPNDKRPGHSATGRFTESGAGGRTRTIDLRITSALLYQLSYAGDVRRKSLSNTYERDNPPTSRPSSAGRHPTSIDNRTGTPGTLRDLVGSEYRSSALGGASSVSDSMEVIELDIHAAMKHDSGFTFIELIVALVVASILVAMAVPHYQDLAERNRLTSATNDFVGALNLARSTAVTRGKTANLCQSNANISPRSCTNNVQWDRGYILWISDDNTVGYQAGTDELIRAWPGLPNNVRLEEDSSGIGSLGYVPSGRLDSGSTFNFYVEPANCSGNEARHIEITGAGRPNSQGDQACTL